MRQAHSDHILDLEQSAAKIESEIETHTETIASRLDETFAILYTDREEGFELPDVRPVLQALQDSLRDSREKLTLAESHHVGLVRRGVELRDERESLTKGLYDDFSALRRTVEEAYGQQGRGKFHAFTVAGIEGPTAQKPAKLLRQIELALGHLQIPGLELPPSRFGGNRLDPAEMVEVLAPRAQRLRIVQAELRRLASELNASRKEKNRALKALKKTFSAVAQGARALFNLAGEQELAERIRPRRPRRTAGGSSPDTGPQETAPDASAPDDASETEPSPVGDVPTEPAPSDS